MTAALSLVEPLPELHEIERLEAAVDAGLAAALDSLTALRERQAHTARGFALWHEYVLARFGDALAALRLPDGERLALVESMCTKTADHPRGLPVREQSRLLGVAVGTIQNDRRDLGLVKVGAPRVKPEPLPAPTGKVYEQAAEWLRRHPEGLTLDELGRLTGWREGKVSGALSYLQDRGLAVRLEDRRAGQRVHLLAGE